MSNQNTRSIATIEPKEDTRKINHGSVAIEQERAIAEARGQIQLAKMFPRSISEATQELIDICKSHEFAETAFYSVPNRGSGPSIRFAEEVARVYGNFQYGHRELSRTDGKSEIEVFAWDVEKNNKSIRQITIDHVRYSRANGNTQLIDPADIDNRIANIASKQMRGRILALVPKSLVAIGLTECRKTLGGNNSASLKERCANMISRFSEYGIQVKHLSDYIGHSLDDITIDDIANLTGVYTALREGASIVDYFDLKSSTEKTKSIDAPKHEAMEAEIETDPPSNESTEMNANDAQQEDMKADESDNQAESSEKSSEAVGDESIHAAVDHEPFIRMAMEGIDAADTLDKLEAWGSDIADYKNNHSDADVSGIRRSYTAKKKRLESN